MQRRPLTASVAGMAAVKMRGQQTGGAVRRVIARWATAAGAGAAAVLTVVACGSSGTAGGAAPASTSASPPAASATPTGALCQDVANLRTSLAKLSPDKVKAAGLATVPATLGQVQADVTTLISNAHGQWEAQTSALKHSLGEARKATSNLAASPSSGEVTTVLSALSQVTVSAQQLLAAADVECPSAAASPAALPTSGAPGSDSGMGQGAFTSGWP
jgi:hypothetical protein